MTTETDTAVHTSVVVETAIDRAFAIFTDDIGSWWPPEHHLGPVASMVFEAKVGGHIYDRMDDGSEVHWSRVLVYEPPTRVVFSWDVSPAWQIESDPARTSEVEVRFVAEGPETTRVEVTHSHLDRHGEGWEQLRDAVASDGGWPLGLGRFGQRVAGGG